MKNADGQPEQTTKNYSEEYVRRVTQKGIQLCRKQIKN
jgi:hypothetical protein